MFRFRQYARPSIFTAISIRTYTSHELWDSVNAHVVYGWKENKPKGAIDHEWLEKEGIERFALLTWKTVPLDAWYGLPATLNEQTGAIEISQADKDKVKKARSKVVEKCKGEIIGELKYHHAVNGGCLEWTELDEYTPGGPCIFATHKILNCFEDSQLYIVGSSKSKMYGTANAYLVYGWMESDRDKVINNDWLDQEGVELFASDMVRNHAGNAIYGVSVKVNEETGAAEISKKDKDKVKRVRSKVVKKCKGEIIGELKFLTGLTGDFEWGQHDHYNPGEAPTISVKRSRFDDPMVQLMTRALGGYGHF